MIVIKRDGAKVPFDATKIINAIQKAYNEVKVHIMGDFRLKFFEMGTRNRKTSGANRAFVRGSEPRWRQHKPSQRGRISAKKFFFTARSNKEKEISDNMNNIIMDSIKKVNGQFKGR